ncbi:MAG: alkaline phosphatase family protein [Candidatus Firestonebacteria bacterium]
MKKVKKSNTLFTLVALFTLVTISTSFAETYNAILISWDGVQREHFMDLYKSDKLPNIKDLSKEGNLVEITVEGHATSTKPGHAEMLTGLTSSVTGVFTNGKFAPIPVGYTIFEKLESHFGKDNIITVMLTGKSGNLGSLGPNEGEGVKKKKGKEKEKENPNGEPFYLTRGSLDIWNGDKQRDAEEVGTNALMYIESYKDKRFCMFFHFSDPDHKGHKSGENSKEYENAIILCDSWLGKIISKLKESQIYNKTLIYVTSDHGFDEGEKNHKNAPYVYLGTNDKSVKKNGTLADIVPTILVQFGIDVSKVKPALTGKPLNQ